MTLILTETYQVTRLILYCFYKKQHYEVVRCIHFQFVKEYGLMMDHHLKNSKVLIVFFHRAMNKSRTYRIFTELQMDHEKHDLIRLNGIHLPGVCKSEPRCYR